MAAVGVFNHLLLRLIFWYDDLLPGDLVRLLDQAAALSLMRRVGGGFIFAHQLIQDHFARQAATGVESAIGG